MQQGSSDDLMHYARLNLNEAGKRSQQLQQVIQDWNSAYAVFREAVQNLGLTQDTDTLFGYRAVCAAAHLAATVEGHTLSLRHPMIEDALDSPLLAKVFEIVPALQQQKAAVGEHFSLEHLPPLTSLQEIRETLHQGGAFRSLSRRWRKARRQYAQVAKTSADASPQAAVERLDALIAYLKATDAFRLYDAALHALLPGVFAGVETDIEALHKIIRFYRAIQERILPLPTYGLMLAQQLKRMDKSFYDWLRQQEPVIRKGLDALDVLVQATRAEEKAATPLPQVLANAEQEIISLKRLETTLVAVGVSRSVEFSLLSESLAAKNEFVSARVAFHIAPAIRQISLSDAAEECPQHLERIAQLLSTARKAFQILPHAILPKVLQVNGHAFLADIKASISGLATYQQQLDRFGQVLGKDAAKLEFWGTTAGSEKQLLERINAKLQHLEDNESSFQQWCDVLNAFDAVRQQNLAVLILSFASSVPEVAFSHYVPLFQYLLYWNLSQQALQQNSVLGSFSRISHENIRKSFQDIDVELQVLNAKKLAWDISRRNLPKGESAGRSPKDYTDMCLISHELSKQKRHVPIRQLVGNAYNALVALKPCFMMGPLSVAQYLAPSNKKFDIVIMDEASQIKPEDALGVLARAKQVVVVGDSNQLPPTSFFDKLGTDAEDEEEVTAIQDSESILDVYKPVFQPNRRLRWHYRSQHQSLISFSNHHFYENDLVIFPSSTAHAETAGVKHVYVSHGVYSSQSNPIEAQQLVQDIVGMIQQFPTRTYGIVTLNAKQKIVMEDEIERVRKDNPFFDDYLSRSEATDEPFFIKNLEGVQGDERDIIFISTTFGPDEAGAFRQNFGPINGKDGWRRLNVLFTRAKQHVRIYSSFLPERIKIDDSKEQRGLRALRDYLQFAATGIDNHNCLTGNEPDSDFERSVGGFLTAQGYEVVYQLGVAGYRIDLVVKHPVHTGSYAIAIECDGATYHSAKSARDRDRLREENLRKLGWKHIHRIWSTDWFRQREKEEQRLLRTVEDAIAVATAASAGLSPKQLPHEVELLSLMR
jgi:REase_MTES_1575/AAA domain